MIPNDLTSLDFDATKTTRTRTALSSAQMQATKNNWIRKKRRKRKRRRRRHRTEELVYSNAIARTQSSNGSPRRSQKTCLVLAAFVLILVAKSFDSHAKATTNNSFQAFEPLHSSTNYSINHSDKDNTEMQQLIHDINVSELRRQPCNRYHSIVECQQSNSVGGLLASSGDCDPVGGHESSAKSNCSSGQASQAPVADGDESLQQQQQQQQQIDQLMGRMSSTVEHDFAEIAPLWIVKDWYEILLRVCFVVPIVLLGVFGNLTIIYSMFEFKPFRSKPTNIFILNTALADLLTTIVCPNAALITDIYQFYVLGAFICRLEGFIKITCLLVSAYSLIVLSTDWLLCVVEPCRSRISIRKSWVAFCAIWIVSVLMASPLIMWRHLRERQWRDVLEVWCCEMIQYTKYYWVCITFFLIYLPTFFMTIVLIIILLQMDKFEAKLKKSRTQQNNPQPSLTRRYLPHNMSKTTTTTNPFDNQRPRALSCTNDSGFSSTSHSNQQHCNSLQSISMKYRRRIMKILFAYLLTSMICWSPLQFVIIYRHFRSETIPSPWFFELAFFASLAASLSSAMNPIIFGFLSEPFRRIVTKSWLFRLIFKLCSNSRRRKVPKNNKNNNNNNHRQLRPQNPPRSNPVANPIRNQEQDRYSHRLYPQLASIHATRSSSNHSNNKASRISRANPSMIRLNFDDIPMSHIARVSGRPVSLNSVDSLRLSNHIKSTDLINNNQDLKRVSFLERSIGSNHHLPTNNGQENPSFEPDDDLKVEVHKGIDTDLIHNSAEITAKSNSCENNKINTTSSISERVRRVA